MKHKSSKQAHNNGLILSDRYELMKKCWKEEKTERPTFLQMKLRLKALLITSRRKETAEAAAAADNKTNDEQEDYYTNEGM